MNARDLFEANLALIDRVIAAVCRRTNVFGADAEDFASNVRIALMEDDYAILRKYEGRASLAAYLSVVVRRLLADERMHRLGRWRPSRESERLGEAAVMLETLLVRDGRSVEDALPLVRRVDPSITRSGARRIAERFPERSHLRPRLIDIESTDLDAVATSDRADAEADARELRDVSQRTAQIVREALRVMPLEDRMLVRFRYARGLSIADIARLMQLPQRPLYRRLEQLLSQLRDALGRAGIAANDIAELIGGPEGELDFGFMSDKEPDAAEGRS